MFVRRFKDSMDNINESLRQHSTYQKEQLQERYFFKELRSACVMCSNNKPYLITRYETSGLILRFSFYVLRFFTDKNLGVQRQHWSLVINEKY